MNAPQASRNDRIDAVVDEAAAAAAAGVLRCPEAWIGALLLGFPLVAGVAPNLALALACAAGTLGWSARATLAGRMRSPAVVGVILAALGLAVWIAEWPFAGREFAAFGLLALLAGTALPRVAERPMLLAVFGTGCAAVALSLLDSHSDWLARVGLSGMILVLASTGSLALRWRGRLLVEVASAAAVLFVVGPDLRRFSGLATEVGFRTFGAVFTAALMVAVAYGAGRVGRHVVRGVPDHDALARLVTWAQVRSWTACGILAGLAATLLFQLLLWEHGGVRAAAWPWEPELGRIFVEDLHAFYARSVVLEACVRSEIRLLMLGLSVLLIACCGHVTLRARSTLAQAVPVAVTLFAVAAASAGDLLLRVSDGKTEWFRAEVWLACALIHVWAVCCALPLRRVTPPWSLLVVGVWLAGAWWVRWDGVFSPSSSPWRPGVLPWMLVLPLTFHAAVASGLSAGRLALLAGALVIACGGAALGSEHELAHPRMALATSLGMTFLAVCALPCVFVARAARSLCAVPPDHPIVADHLGGHPAARPRD